MNTDLILLDNRLHEINVVTSDVDFEVGNSEALNNFELYTVPFDAYGFYIEGTEYGGVFEYEHGTSDDINETIKGWTWRGLLTQGIIIPPSGSDYYIASGDANAVIGNLLSGYLGGFFTVPNTVSGCTISNYQFPLYCNLLDGIMDMLTAYDYRLSIHADKPAAGSAITVTVEAVPAEQVEGVFNEDSPMQLEYTFDRMGVNHLVCMGAGELQQRMRVDLYLDANGNVSTTQYYTGFEERTAYFDYSSAESRDDLITYGTRRLLEIASSNTVEVHADDGADMEVGDLIFAVYKGVSVTVPIVRKVLKIERGMVKVEYKVKGEQ